MPLDKLIKREYSIALHGIGGCSKKHVTGLSISNHSHLAIRQEYAGWWVIDHLPSGYNTNKIFYKKKLAEKTMRKLLGLRGLKWKNKTAKSICGKNFLKKRQIIRKIQEAA